MRILLVEDDAFKLQDIDEFLRQLLRGAEIEVARSVSAAARVIQSGQFDLLILDMSLPTYDIGPRESGGRPQGFGGLNVMRLVDSLGVKVKVIVVTQFERFGDGEDSIDLASLRASLERDYPDRFLGLVFYDGSGQTWKVKLQQIAGAAQ